LVIMESLRLRRTMIEFTFRVSPLKIRSFIACLPSRLGRIGHGDPRRATYRRPRTR